MRPSVRKKVAVAIVGTLVAAPFLLFYVTFICGVPVAWPYYEPELEGAEIVDGSVWYLPRAGMAPYVFLPLGEGAFARIATRCYPNFRGEAGQCSLTIGFAAPLGADIAFGDRPVVARTPDDRNVIDIDHYVAYAERFASDRRANRIRDGELYLTFSDFMRTGSVLLKVDAGPEFTAQMPTIEIDGRTVPVPPISFRRVENLTCHGLFANF